MQRGLPRITSLSSRTVSTRGVRPKSPRRRKRVRSAMDSPPESALPGSLRVAVIGCAHGEVDAIYDAIDEAARARPGAARGVDLVLCTGDFQAVRNEDDLECMAVPDKYKDIGRFWRYYAGTLPETGGSSSAERRSRGGGAPIPTIVVGGNHEASNHLQELPLGGLLAPNIYYLGPSGVVNFRGLRIGGISGVYTAHNYSRTKHEAPPYPGTSIKSVYHTRVEDVELLARLKRPLDVFMSHDWPTGIVAHGDRAALLRAKPFLASEINDGSFGSPGSARLLDLLRPRYWFAAHIHVKFAALVNHAGSDASTRFLALDKALPRRDFVQILDIFPATGAAPFSGQSAANASTQFKLDPEWLAILRTHGTVDATDSGVSDKDMSAACSAVTDAGMQLSVQSPEDFERNARIYDPKAKKRGIRPTTLVAQRRNRALVAALGLDSVPGCVARGQGDSSDAGALSTTVGNPKLALQNDQTLGQGSGKSVSPGGSTPKRARLDTTVD